MRFAAAGVPRNQTLDAALQSLKPTIEELTEAFFDRVIQNLREGQVRIVFFLEDSPMELRSIVDFLNRQMERAEVLLVEARLYSWEGKKIVVPTLFGFTEQARAVKRPITVGPRPERKRWDKASFFAQARGRLREDQVLALEAIHEGGLAVGYEIGWGTGATTASFNLYDQTICPRSLFTVYADGRLWVNFGALRGETEERAQLHLKDLVQARIGLQVPDDQADKYPSYPSEEWVNKTPEMIEVLREFRCEFHRNGP